MEIERNKNSLRISMELYSSPNKALKYESGDNVISRSQQKLMKIIFMSFFVLGALNVGAMDVSMKPICDKLNFKADDNKWIRFGAGYRGTGIWSENIGTGNINEGRYSNDNARIYLNGQFGPYLKFEVNTECYFCNNTKSGDNPRMSYNILDAIVKFEYNRYLNVWGGRMLAPTERGELNGPFFHATHDGFKTPFFSQDFSTSYNNNNGAGMYGRDDGATFWGSAEPKVVPGTFSYAMGIFRGLRSTSAFGPNPNDSVLMAARFTYNFLNPEKNPGYYTVGTYYGKGGEILVLGFGMY